MHVRLELYRRLRAEEQMLPNCGTGGDSWESLGLQRDQPVNLKGNQSWKFIGRIVADAETQIIWLTDAKSWLIKKDPVVGKDWRQKENEVTEDEIVRHHHWLNGHEFEKIPGDSEGQSSLLCCSPWGWEELEMTYQLNSNKVSHRFYTRV